GPDRDRPATRLLDLGDGLGAIGLVEVEHRDGQPVSGEALGGAGPDAPGGPGHDRDSLWHIVAFPFPDARRSCRRTPVFLRHYSGPRAAPTPRPSAGLLRGE